MPPPESHKTLKPEEIAALRRWIAEGAVYEQHWSFIPPIRPAVPAVARAQAKGVRNPIDAFVFLKLKEKGIKPSPVSDKRTLIRRAYLDLTGLPPTIV